MGDIDVFAGNYTLIDWDIHMMWLNGYNPHEAAVLLRDQKNALRDHPGVTFDYLMSDVNDQFRVFSMLENEILSNGLMAFTSDHFQFVSDDVKRRLVESFYSLDDQLCREILGKKLNSRLRKDLDEICEKSPSCQNIRLKSAKRQFDNVKRVFKTTEEMAGDYVANIKAQFGLSQKLAEKYTTLVFLSSFRFEISKKRLAFLQFDDFRVMSLILIEDWLDCDGTTTGKNDENEEPALDKDFLTSLRDLKAIQERDKEHRHVMSLRLKSHISTAGVAVADPAGGDGTGGDPNSRPKMFSSSKAYSELEANFKPISRGIISVAISLSHSKEVKDFFVHVVEKVVETLRLSQVTLPDVELFLTEYARSITDATSNANSATMLVDNEVRCIFARFMKTLRPVVLVAFRRSQQQQQ